MQYNILIRRVYNLNSTLTSAINANANYFLIDRLWPRGIKKSSLPLHTWLKEVTPSTQLRQAWHKQELDFDQFSTAYKQELDTLDPDTFIPLMQAARCNQLVLLSAVKNLDKSHVPVLKQKIIQLLEQEDWEADAYEPSSPPCYLHEFKNNY